MMNTFLLIMLGLIIGAAGGLFFFAGLWWTLKYLPGKKNPILLAAVSFIVRMVIILMLFYYLAVTTRIEVILAALSGFIVMRYIMIKTKAGKPKENIKPAIDNEQIDKGGDV